MAGALADFARRPTRVKIGIFAALGALLGLLYWQFGYQPLKKSRTQAESELAADRADEKKLKEQKDEYDRKVLRQDELKRQIEQNQKALPTESEMPAFFDMLARRTGEAGVEPIKRLVGKEVQIETFVKVPVDIEVTGTFYQLKRFFASLRPDGEDVAAMRLPSDPVEEKDRIVTIENLSIADPKVKNGEIMLTAKFTAATFRAADQPEPAVTPPAAKPAAGTSGNPQQMKGQVEGAGAASETRVQKVDGDAGGKPATGAGTGTGRVKGGM